MMVVLGLMLATLLATQLLALAPPIATQLLIDQAVAGQDRRWLLGIANLRGHLLPLVDLKLLLGSGRTTLRRTTRVISVNHREIPAGLVVDEVQGFRRFMEHEFSETRPETAVRCERYLAGEYRRGDESWPIFDLFAFVESNLFLQAADE
mgnify:CR=1 FL=1